jgi:hypothetical protein
LQLTSDFFTYDYCDTDNLIRQDLDLPKVSQQTVEGSISKKVEKKKKKSPLQAQMHTCASAVCKECNRGLGSLSGSIKNQQNSLNSVSKKKKRRGF